MVKPIVIDKKVEIVSKAVALSKFQTVENRKRTDNVNNRNNMVLNIFISYFRN